MLVIRIIIAEGIMYISPEQSLVPVARHVRAPAAPPSLDTILARLAPHWRADWAWANYRTTVVTLSREFGLRRLCEVGGGRDPLFTPHEARALGVELTINDIAQSELDCAPAGFHKACFDIAGDLSATNMAGERYDLMFSRMVFEHVADVEQAWRNIHMLLAPGGVALAFFPTLYALPFLVNHLIPEWLSGAILRALYPGRRSGGNDPKFPAVYDHCFGDEASQRAMLAPIGFGEIKVVPFWGSDYFLKFSGLRELDAAFSAFAARRDWRLVTTHAYVLVRKNFADASSLIPQAQAA